MRSSDSTPTSLDRYFRRIFGDDEPSNLGSGWVGGVGSVLGGALSLFGVLCLHFPRLLTAPVLRPHYPVALLRGVLQAALIASVLLGLFSVARRRPKILGLTGIFLAVLVLADFTQYWIHRAFHRLSWLWRFYVHHSSTSMDWLAGSRMHPLDALATRAGVMTVLVLAGASPPAVALYLAFVSFHAVFIHANFGASLKRLEALVATPPV